MYYKLKIMSGKSRSVIRKVSVYHEVGANVDRFNVSRDRAERLTAAAFSQLGNVIGSAIEVESMRGIRLGAFGNVVKAEKLKIPGEEAHQLLLTGRELTSRNRAMHGTVLMVGQYVRTQEIVHVPTMQADPYSAYAVGTIIHEGAHTFGLGHCAIRDCIMHERYETMRGDFDSKRMENPFCNPCAGELELLGYSALAKTL